VSEAVERARAVSDKHGVNWSDESILELLGQYIDNQESGQSLEDFLEQRAEEENNEDATGRWSVDEGDGLSAGQAFAEHKWTSLLKDQDGCVVAIGGANHLEYIRNAVNEYRRQRGE
jgi:hypothetical protein